VSEKTYDDANSKTNTPDAIMGLASVRSDNYKRHNTRGYKTGDDSSVGGNSNKHTAPLSHSLGAIGTFNGLRGTYRVLSS
jgi:hypothetical protein